MFILAFCGPEREEAGVVGSSNYADLVGLYLEFPEFLIPNVNNAVPDYSAVAMDAQKRGLKQFQDRFTAIDISGWPVSQQVDYHVVRSEMKGVELEHWVIHPGSRDPSFYNILHYQSRPMYGLPMLIPSLPLPAGDITEFRTKLKAIPEIYKQAKVNLTEGSEELALIAARTIKKLEIPRLRTLADQLAEHHPDLVLDTEKGIVALEGFHDWLEENKSKMTAPAGIGKDNYNWWLKNVQLIPYTMDEYLTIVEREYDRAITFLKLEEQRNQELPDFKMTANEREHRRCHNEAAQYLMRFLREKEIITVPDRFKTSPCPTVAGNTGKRSS